MIMIVFLVVFLGAAYWWLNRKPEGVSPPSREDTLILLRKVCGGLNTELEWDTFVTVPIEKDVKLEEIRRKCAAIQANVEFRKDLKEDFIFNEQGLREVKTLIAQLEGHIKADGHQKTEFQINCSQILEHKLQQLGLSFTSWTYIESQEESFYQGELKGVKVCVYEDGASIKSEHGSYMFESREYKTESELTRALVGKFTELVTSP